jgi:hypothetical protein
MDRGNLACMYATIFGESARYGGAAPVHLAERETRLEIRPGD